MKTKFVVLKDEHVGEFLLERAKRANWENVEQGTGLTFWACEDNHKSGIYMRGEWEKLSKYIQCTLEEMLDYLVQLDPAIYLDGKRVTVTAEYASVNYGNITYEQAKAVVEEMRRRVN